MAFTPTLRARHPLTPPATGGRINDAAGFASRYGPLSRSPNRAFDAGLRPGPSPDQAASLLPGLLAATRTGLTPASDDELHTTVTVLAHDHLRGDWTHRDPSLHSQAGDGSLLGPDGFSRLAQRCELLPGQRRLHNGADAGSAQLGLDTEVDAGDSILARDPCAHRAH